MITVAPLLRRPLASMLSDVNVAWLADAASWLLPIAVIATTIVVFRRRAPAVSRALLGGMIGLFVGGLLGITLSGWESGFVLGFLGGALVGVVALGGVGLSAGKPSASPRFLRRTAVLVAIAGLLAGLAISALFVDLCGSDPADTFFVCTAPAIPLALVFAQPVAFVVLILGSARAAELSIRRCTFLTGEDQRERMGTVPPLTS